MPAKETTAIQRMLIGSMQKPIAESFGRRYALLY
jgi:hypothetical protein